MARLLNIKPETDVKDSLNLNIKSRLGTIYNGKDSTANIVSESIAIELVELRRSVNATFDNMQISNAGGEFLDMLAFEMYQITRRPMSYSSVDSRQRNLHFYVDTGTFGDINDGVDISLPSGTLLSVDSSFGEGTIMYEITEDYILSATSNFEYCSARALNPGSYANVREGSLIYHTFTNYSDALSGSLKVKNRYPIINGAEAESDDSLRFRISNHLNAITNNNNKRILLKALEVPGVTEIKIVPSYFGIGTTGVVVFGAGRELSQDVLLLVQDRMNEINTPGQNIEAIMGIKVYFDFTIRVYIKSGLPNFTKIDIKSNIKRQVLQFIKQKEFSNILDFLEISRIAVNNITRAEIIGFATKENSSNIFENVAIRKTDRFSLFPEEREELLEDVYYLKPEERASFGEIQIILEEDLR